MIRPEITPFQHQELCYNFITSPNGPKEPGSGAIFADIGTGKTLMGLLSFAAQRKIDPYLKLVVICPISLIHAAWEEDIKKFTTFKFQSLRDKKILNADIYAINFETVSRDKGEDIIRELNKNYRLMVIVDESQRMKNNKSAISKNLLKLSTCFDRRVIMSGCPTPNGYHEFWAQMRFINPNIFHKSFTVFKSEFFHLARGSQVIDDPKILLQMAQSRTVMHDTLSKGFQYAVTDEKKKELLAIIKPYCFFANIDECLDLPPITKVVREAIMTPALRKNYNELAKQLVTEIQGVDIAAPVALTKLMKLRELTGGFIITTESKTLEVDCPKIEVLNEILEDAGPKQVIIWNNFTWESNRITQELGIDRCAVLNGQVKDKDKEIKDFQEGRKQYLVAHPKSGGAGLTFVNSCLMVDYSLDYSHDNAVQTDGRFRRPGQKSTHLTRIRIIMKDSIDEIILGVLDGKYDEWQIVRMFLAQTQGGR